MNVKPLFTEMEAKALMISIDSTIVANHHRKIEALNMGALMRAQGKMEKAIKKFNAEETVKTYLMEKEYDVPAEERTVGDDEFQMCAKLVPLKVKAVRKWLEGQK
jgi:tRNA G37 N-methylase Trm5